MLAKPEAEFVVTSAYLSLLGREPDCDGLLHFASWLSAAKEPVDVAQALLGSEEFFNLFGLRFDFNVDTPVRGDGVEERAPESDELMRRVRVLSIWVATLAGMIAPQSAQEEAKKSIDRLNERLDAISTDQATLSRRLDSMLDLTVVVRQATGPFEERLRSLSMDQAAIAHRILSFEEQLAATRAVLTLPT